VELTERLFGVCGRDAELRHGERKLACQGVPVGQVVARGQRLMVQAAGDRFQIRHRIDVHAHSQLRVAGFPDPPRQIHGCCEGFGMSRAELLRQFGDQSRT
jgi:hypothetical protein